MGKVRKIVLILTMFLPSIGFSAPPPSFKVTNEMIYQKLIDIEKRQAVFEERFKQIDKRFEQIDKRFEDMNKRFEELREDMNKRFEEVNARFEQLTNFLWIITGIFTAIMVGTIGFAYWDRRTIIAEAKRQTLEELEREVKPERLKKLINVAREFAKKNEEFREILKKEDLL